MTKSTKATKSTAKAAEVSANVTGNETMFSISFAGLDDYTITGIMRDMCYGAQNRLNYAMKRRDELQERISMLLIDERYAGEVGQRDAAGRDTSNTSPYADELERLVWQLEQQELAVNVQHALLGETKQAHIDVTNTNWTPAPKKATAPRGNLESRLAALGIKPSEAA